MLEDCRKGDEKMAKTIAFGMHKGGSGRSTATGVLSYLLSQNEFRILSVDTDPQGNLTELLSNDSSNKFVEKSILEAIQYHNARKYIVSIGENLDLLPANNFLASFPRWIYTKKTYKNKTVNYYGRQSLLLDKLLDQVRDEYDLILIDTPKNLSELTINALCASDEVVVVFECSEWSYSAIPDFMDSIESANEFGKRNTSILGILRNLSDVGRIDAKAYSELIEEDYPNDVFDTIIKRKAAVGRIPSFGFSENQELKKALEQYESLYKELLARI